MIRALVIKELRESAGIVALAVVSYLYILGVLTDHNALPQLQGFPRGQIPFLGTQFYLSFGLVSVILAIALGFRQSLVESRRGTYLFLLHRPWPTSAIFLTKLAVGVGLLWLCSGLTILVYAVWAATPGHVPAPFEWSMTAGAWWFCACLPIAYQGAFMSGLRPAFWYGTRLLPLVASIFGLALCQTALWSWPLTLTLIVALYVIFTSAICSVARSRDYS